MLCASAEPPLQAQRAPVPKPDSLLGCRPSGATRPTRTLPASISNYITDTGVEWGKIMAAGVLVTIVLCANLIGDGLRDALDPGSANLQRRKSKR